MPIELLRNGKRLSVNALIAERPPPGAQLSQAPQFQLPVLPPRARGSHGQAAAAGDAESLHGVQVAELTPAIAQSLSLPRGEQGVIVRQVEPGSSAADKLQPGDIIEQVNQQPVPSVPEFGKQVRALPENLPFVLSVMRERARVLVVLSPG